MNDADIVREFTTLPAPATPIPETVRSNTFWLFKDSEWSKDRRVMIDLDEYVEKKRHMVPSSIHDVATWVAYNLPVGTVVTLIERITPLEEGVNFADIRGCGVCLDLIGTGKTEAIDLKKVSMNDKISTWFWRTVDLKRGAIEMFEHENFIGGRATIFLAEWEAAKVHSINGWWINDRVTSVRWKTLHDRQTASLINNPDGTGTTFDNINGWMKCKEVLDFKELRFNDVMSGFRWDGLIPLKETMKPFKVTATGVESIDNGLEHHSSGRNETSEAMTSSIDFKVGTVREWSITTTEEHVAGIDVTITREADTGIPGVGNLKATWEVTLKYTYTHTESTTTVNTKSTDLIFTQNFTAPPHSAYAWDVFVYVGKIPTTTYHTTATRWYKVQVGGSVADPENNGWFKREEDISVTVSGILATRFDGNFKTSAL